MEIKVNAVYGMVGERFKGNVSAFSRALNINRTTAWRALEGRSSGAIKFIPALANYCKNNKIDPQKYISI